MTTPKHISLSTLEEITKRFSVDSRIGKGGYADVYKGVYEGRDIAVKLLHVNMVLGHNVQLFINEVGNHFRAEHENIVQFVGYCYETKNIYVDHYGAGKFREHIYKVICSEYLQVGSLHKRLYDRSFAPDWSTRYNIIKGVCEGLNYLHNSVPQILHLDLKPANILLNSSMEPKLADLGLSRLFTQSRTHVTKNIIGTRKYMPPEFINGGEISPKNDIYSLGVVMTDIMTDSVGYSNSSEMDDVALLTQQVFTNWSTAIVATSKYPMDEKLQLQTCIELAIRCVDPKRDNRPSVADILVALNKTETNIPNRKKKRKFDEHKEVALHNDSMFILLPPVGRELPLPPNIVGQNNYLEEIVARIRQGTTSLIGICGMGGAGKTTLLTQVNNTFSRAAELHEFDHVIYVEIGQQQPDIGTVQQSIASQLGLTLGKYESTKLRSASLYKFLKERKFLLLMDNLWKPLDLVEVGVQGQGETGPQNRQMVVITTRDQQICHRMKALNHLILLTRLDSEQAWSLFEANAGCHILTNSSAEIRVHAKIIVEKCGGLPLALKVVGKAMASKESEHDWELAVILLEKSQYHKVPDADAESDLYPVLYISYNQLLDERTKQCLLFFALITSRFVYIPYAIDFWMRHGLLDDDGDISKNYLRGHSVVGCLKRACLLEEHPRGESFLRMHDTIRGLVLWIVKCKQGDGPNKNWLVRVGKETVEPEEYSTAHRISFLGLWGVVDLGGPCGQLSTLIHNSNSLTHVPTGFFRIATSLTFLDLSRSLIRELPSGVGELVNLQYLALAETPMESIPMELQLLKSLRYLNLNGTFKLKTIPDGTISALIMLRSLDLYRSWCFPPDKTQTHIEELKSLTWLQSLGLTVSDSDSLQCILDSSKSTVKYLCIENVEGLRVLNITPALFSKTRAHQLEHLTLYNINSLEELSIGETIVDSDWNFEILVELRLEGIVRLENIIWKGVVPHACFPRLCRLMVRRCHGIRAITWIKQLPWLQELFLLDCDSILELVADDAERLTMSSDGNSFPRLKLVGLSCLPNLQNICDSKLAFPCLQGLLLYNCPKLAKLPSGLLQPEHVPLILCQQKLWEQLSWEDSSVKTRLFPFFRDLPEGFKGHSRDVLNALVT